MDGDPQVWAILTTAYLGVVALVKGWALVRSLIR
ncbi:MAG: hypothetical protein QOI54_1827 [Actinomycetota bacterium]|nr:hypothetical protein [Actinomycetota bacterium]